MPLAAHLPQSPASLACKLCFASRFRCYFNPHQPRRPALVKSLVPSFSPFAPAPSLVSVHAVRVPGAVLVAGPFSPASSQYGRARLACRAAPCSVAAFRLPGAAPTGGVKLHHQSVASSFPLRPPVRARRAQGGVCVLFAASALVCRSALRRGATAVPDERSPSSLVAFLGALGGRGRGLLPLRGTACAAQPS
ncbi:hypothetical protein ERJ75_000654600 [Trypanosoma vivax]|nr:hypothetical protein ERJ75_000654600 [Trypanosoma vivax]